MKKPNIFNYATSELSQDAFIKWLIKWASNEFSTTDKEIHNCASTFVKSLIGESQDYQIKNIDTDRQWKNIDIWAKVNDDYFIVIEDKKGTNEHSDQLKRYAEIAEQHYKSKNMKIVLVYFKMEEQGKYTAIDESGYTLFTREKMLSILEPYFLETKNGKGNNILLDYYFYLKELDEKINGFKTLPLDEWGEWYSWKGFFATIQKEIGGQWDYVPNASGGFLGFWWSWQKKNLDGKEFDFYLQLEYEKLVFKLSANNPDFRRELRDYYRSNLYKMAAELNIEIHQYGRIGQYMGVAKLNSDYRILNKNGLIDISATIENLRKMEHLIKTVGEKMNQ